MTNPFYHFDETLLEVSLALVPLVIFFIVFQLFVLKLPMKRVWNIAFGFLCTFFGLAFFLQGVHVGFMPFGEAMGHKIASFDSTWVLIPIGFILGFVVTFAEPAVRILNEQVDEESGGAIPEKVMLYTLSIGVGVSVALAMARIIYGIPFWYIIIPGYIIALSLIFFTSKSFISIAFDSGGVATGPMTVTFILAMAVGIATEIEGRDPLVDGFGMIAMVAITPIISVLILGVLYKRKEGKT